MSESPAPQIPLSAFEDLVAQYHHRLLSLEADLKDRARSGQLAPTPFAKRVKKLKDVQVVLNELQKMCVAEKAGSTQQSDIGLPLLDECTPEERAVCERFLIEREASMLRFAEQGATVLRWLQNGLAGKTGLVRSTLRLSKLRRFIQDHDQKISTLQEQSKALGICSEKLLATLKPGAPREIGRSTIAALMTLFQQIDGTIARVARLRAVVKKEEARIKEITETLQKNEALLAEADAAASRPPTPLSTARARAEAGGTLERELGKPIKRQRLSERFWTDVIEPMLGLTPPATQPSKSSPAEAPEHVDA